jgi:hypothetical protein
MGIYFSRENGGLFVNTGLRFSRENGGTFWEYRASLKIKRGTFRKYRASFFTRIQGIISQEKMGGLFGDTWLRFSRENGRTFRE